MIKTILFTSLLSGLSIVASAQRPARSSMMMVPAPISATPLIFNSDADISKYAIPAKPIEWGMDTAWDWDVNVNRGTSIIGKDILTYGVGRVSFQPSDLVDAAGHLSAEQQRYLDSRLNHMKATGATHIMLNCDHEVLMNKESYINCDQNYANYNGKPYEWYRVIKASVEYCRREGFIVDAVSPFNEPDYAAWKEGTKAEFQQIAKYIKEDPDLAGIRICGGNTLNCDQAKGWYDAIKPYIDEGNTHQLAGSFNNYAAFWQLVESDGNRGTADELHNTMEAFVGIHYGMDAGIWWGMDGLTRGEFCKASWRGKEIGYAEHRGSWTAATVYKRENGRIDAFLGGSERQANNHTYNMVATNRPVFFDGYGPVYNYAQAIPGGTGYQNGQTNAECKFQISHGEDVPLEAITKQNYFIVNDSVRKPIGFAGNTVGSGKPLVLPNITSGATTKPKQQWLLSHVGSKVGGDFSYYYLRAATDTLKMVDLFNGKLNDGASIYGYQGPGANEEQWAFEPAGNGLWYIRSRHSGLYLDIKSGSTNYIVQKVFSGSDSQKWRLIPGDDFPGTTKIEFVAPAAPQSLRAKVQSSSVALQWDKVQDADLKGYVIQRSVDGIEWDVIGTMIPDSAFIDNDIVPGKSYTYRVKAVDNSRNQSGYSATTTVSTEAALGKSLVARYQFESSAVDSTENVLDGVVGGTVTYTKTAINVKEGTASFTPAGKGFLQIPSGVANSDELTVTTWMKTSNYTYNYQRIFDFGNDTDHYLFLTANTASSSNSTSGQLRFGIKNGGSEQTLSITKLSNTWHHVALTIGKDSVSIYVDGKLKATTKSITIRPSDIKPVQNFIGRSQFEVDPVLNAYLDDFRIYNCELSADEIDTVMRGGDPVFALKGDVNGDGKVTIADADAIVNFFLGMNPQPFNLQAADVNDDGKVTIADANAVVNMFIGE